MQGLQLNNIDKQYVQRFLENISSKDNIAFTQSLQALMAGRESTWLRYLKGAYNHPVTWWIGIIQLQMQMGVWGHKWKGVAQVRANSLWQVSKPLRTEVYPLSSGPDGPNLLSAIFKYNIKYRKADILGRLSGGVFTNFASTGGIAGSRVLKRIKGAKFTRGALNFIIASYGAGIKAIIEGERTIAPIIQSIITGRTEQLPANYEKYKSMVLSRNEKVTLENLELYIGEMLSLSQLSPGPIPIKEFCTRPENINLKSICK